MRSRHSLWTTVAVVALLAAGSATAAGNQPPTAAAGLDQTVTSGTTVYLDAGNSDDPDGSVASVSWSIQAPNGSEVTPSCVSCTAPTFTPDTTGRWTATVTVTDDDGATAMDTLYVTVEAPRGPDLSVTAPETAVEGQSTAFTVDSDADDADLRSVALYHDGSRADQHDVGGQSASTDLSYTFDDTGTTELRATVTDEDGYVNTTTVSVEVVAPSEASVSAFGSGGTFTPSCDDPAAERVFRNGQPGSMCSSSDMVIDMQGGNQVVAIRTAALDTGIRLYRPEFGRVVQVTSPEQAQELKQEAGNEAIPLEKVNKVFQKNVENGNINKENADRTNNVDIIDDSSNSIKNGTPSGEDISLGSGMNRRERMVEHDSSPPADLNCCSDPNDGFSPSPDNRLGTRSSTPSSDSVIDKSNIQESEQDSAIDDKSDSENPTSGVGCPPDQAHVPISVEQKIC